MSQYISGQTSFGGLGNGTDFQEMIDQLKKIEKKPMQRMELWRADWQKRSDAFDQLITGMTDLSKKLSSIDSISKFLTKAASSSASNVVTVKASSDAREGSYAIEVEKLATNAVLSTKDTFAKTEVVTTTPNSVFKYEYNGKEHSINVAPETTMESLVNLINNDQKNPGVRASLIKSGSEYIFQLQGDKTGEAANLKILDPAFDKDGNATGKVGLSAFPPTYISETNPDTGDITQVPNSSVWYERTAQDAVFTLDGRTEQKLTSDSNVLTEAVPGLSLTLNSTGKTQITVTNDAAAAKKNIVEFVEGVNTLLKQFQDLTKVDKGKSTNEDPMAGTSQYTAQKGSVLTGNYGVQLLNSKLKNLGVGYGIGFTPKDKDGIGDTFAALSSIGISLDADEASPTFGQLKILEGETKPGSPFKTLDDALKEDPEAVAMLFAADNEPRCDSDDFSFASQQKGMTQPGAHKVSYTLKDGKVVGAVMINGKPASYSSESKQWTSTQDPSKNLAIRIDNLADGTYSGTVNIKQGKITELNQALKAELKNDTSSSTPQRGALMVLKDNYRAIMDNIDKKIEKEETRLALWETRQKMKFSRLDALLAGYDKQMAANASALPQMNNNSK